MLKRSEVCDATGLCYTTIYNLEKRGEFPARRRLSPGRVGWLRADVEHWLSNLSTCSLTTWMLDASDGRFNLFGLLA